MKTKKTSVVVLELKRIAEENDGLLKAETVVEEASEKSSPLHHCFQWDDGVAGHLWRIRQARELIRVSVEVLAGTNQKYDVFVSLSTDREKESGGYRILADVLSDAGARAQMLIDALAELEVFREKYRKLSELAAVFSAIRKVKRK